MDSTSCNMGLTEWTPPAVTWVSPALCVLLAYQETRPYSTEALPLPHVPPALVFLLNVGR